MSQLSALNIVELRSQNEDRYNIEVEVPLTDTVGVIVKTKPSTDVISSIVQTYTETLMQEQTNMSHATAETLQYFLLGVLLKRTTNINFEAATCEQYVDTVLQLIRAGYIKQIIAAFGEDYERILQEIAQQLTEYSKILNTLKKKETAAKKKRTSKKSVAGK